jgi:hypothetical protein
MLIVEDLTVTVICRTAIRELFLSFNKIGMYCLSAKHAALRIRSKDGLAPNLDNVSEWGDVFIRGLLLQ